MTTSKAQRWINFSLCLGLVMVLGFEVVKIDKVSERSAHWLQGHSPTETEFTEKLTEKDFKLKDAANIEGIKDAGQVLSLFGVIILMGGIQHGIDNHDPRFMNQCLVALVILIAAMVASPQLLLAVLAA